LFLAGPKVEWEAIAVLLAAVGCVGCMLRVTLEVGRLRGMFEQRLATLEKRADRHSHEIDEHGDRIKGLEVLGA